MREWIQSITGRVVILILSLYLVIGTGMVVFVRGQFRDHALNDARERAELLLTRNLAVHAYFNQELKPELFRLTDPILEDGSFHPSWMSSTYAVRRITTRADTESDQYYYKECAIDARSPENEADEYEADYLRALNSDSAAGERSGIRTVNGERVFYLLRRGEVMEESCLRCHSTPDAAPTELVAYYGPERSFGREVGEVVSALSIRIPLTAAYAEADAIAARMSAVLLALLVAVMAIFYTLTRGMLIKPLESLRTSASEMRSGARMLGEGVDAYGPLEIRDLGSTIDALALDLDRRITQLETASIQVQSAAATRDRFLANLSHELRTPLNAIIGFAGAMKMELAGPLTDEQRSEMEMIYGSGKHLLALVERLLEYSVIEAGVDRVDTTWFSPCKVARDVVRLFEPVAAEKGIDLIAVDCRCESEAYTDRFKVEQILINLVANAVKFTERGHVAVTVSQEGGCLRIDVADTGTGIPAAYVESVFEKFTQLQKEGTVKPEGTGLGLTISREYARTLGGDITVESAPGSGSTFTLRLPLEYDEGAHRQPDEGCPAG